MTKHGSPPPGHCCQFTFDDITEEAKNYCEYRTSPSETWHACGFSAEIVRELQGNQFSTYMANVEKASKDCAAAVRRLVVKGPPVYIEDRIAMPIPDEDTHVDMLWFADTDEEISAKLADAKEGDEKDELWDAQKQILEAMEAAESDK